MEDVRWTVALSYADAVDAAVLAGNTRDMLSATKGLATVLDTLELPEGGAARDGGGVPAADEPKGHGLYDGPPTVGDTPDP